MWERRLEQSALLEVLDVLYGASSSPAREIRYLLLREVIKVCDNAFQVFRRGIAQHS